MTQEAPEYRIELIEPTQPEEEIVFVMDGLTNQGALQTKQESVAVAGQKGSANLRKLLTNPS